jgi:Holliday junction resolvase RusA-like endonuclease
MIAFKVYGLAQPAGSKRAFMIGGKARITDANKKAKPWKQEVAAAAEAAMNGRPPIQGPVRLQVVFFRPRPKGHFRKDGVSLLSEGERNPYPATKPDTTKLLRGLEDACTSIVWRDDAQVVAQHAFKQWGEPALTTVLVFADEEIK